MMQAIHIMILIFFHPTAGFSMNKNFEALATNDLSCAATESIEARGYVECAIRCAERRACMQQQYSQGTEGPPVCGLSTRCTALASSEPPTPDFVLKEAPQHPNNGKLATATSQVMGSSRYLAVSNICSVVHGVILHLSYCHRVSHVSLLCITSTQRSVNIDNTQARYSWD